MDQESEVDVVFAGEVFCDLVFAGTPGLPEPGGEVFAEEFTVSAGGTATRCVAAARLGLRTGLVAVVGRDMFGDHVTAELGAQRGLDLRWLRHLPGGRTPVTVAVANREDRSFITYEEAATHYPAHWEGPLPRARALHIGMRRPLPEWVARMRAAGTLVVGGIGWDATGQWSPELLDRLGQVDVFLPNAVEATSYTRTRTAEEAAEALAERVAHVVVTDGADGAVGIDPTSGGVVRVPSPRVEVADPTGAGDVFTAGYLYGVLAGWPLADRMRFAALCAASSVRTLGGARSAPTPADLRAFLDTGASASARDHQLIGAATARTTSQERE